MIEQRSSAWFTARTGHATASRIFEIVDRLKGGGYTAKRAAYAAQLVAERITGQIEDHYVSKAMLDGVEREDAACALYAFRHDVALGLAEYVPHPTIAMSGASPDRLCGDDGLVEAKAPLTTTHIATILNGFKPENVAQCHWQLACTGRAYCDLISYHPAMPSEMQLFVHRIERDDALIASMEEEVRKFLGEVAETVEAVRGKFK